MRKILLLSVFVVMSFLVGMIMGAGEVEAYCLDGQERCQDSYNVEVCDLGDWAWLQYCTYGCSSDSCNSRPTCTPSTYCVGLKLMSRDANCDVWTDDVCYHPAYCDANAGCVCSASTWCEDSNNEGSRRSDCSTRSSYCEFGCSNGSCDSASSCTAEYYCDGDDRRYKASNCSTSLVEACGDLGCNSDTDDCNDAPEDACAVGDPLSCLDGGTYANGDPWGGILRTCLAGDPNEWSVDGDNYSIWCEYGCIEKVGENDICNSPDVPYCINALVCGDNELIKCDPVANLSCNATNESCVRCWDTFTQYDEDEFKAEYNYASCVQTGSDCDEATCHPTSATCVGFEEDPCPPASLLDLTIKWVDNCGGVNCAAPGNTNSCDEADAPPPPPPVSARDIYGRVYVDSDAFLEVGGRCSGSTAVPWTDGASPQSSVSLSSGDGSGGSIAADGTYSITGITALTGQVANLSVAISGWGSVCGINSFTMPDSDLYGVNFFVSNMMDAWWQTEGGDVGSNAGNLVSSIPTTCLPGICYPFMTRGTSDSSGILTYYTGTNSFGDGGTASEGVDYVSAATIPTNRGIEGYDYFFRQFEMGPTPVDDFSDGKDGVGQPDSEPSNGRAYFSDGSLTLDGSWDLAPAESIVVFVEGDLVVDTQIVVDFGEFLSFVVSGDITFNTGDADPASETIQAQGVFIADGRIITSTGSDRFIGEGIFVGWGGVTLGRDYGDADNNTYPGELFIFRPDFVTNSPDAMRRPVFRWEEVAP